MDMEVPLEAAGGGSTDYGFLTEGDSGDREGQGGEGRGQKRVLRGPEGGQSWVTTVHADASLASRCLAPGPAWL